MTVDQQEPKSTVKRDTLTAIESEMQAYWDSINAFEADAPEDLNNAPPKYMATFPYPYMNGKLHLGHSFTLTKAEFAIGFERLKGKRTLYPFGFHCTGMPIKACADKLAREVEMFGQDFENYKPEDNEEDESGAKKHSKVAAKTGNAKYQFQIMDSMGVPKDEIHKFADPLFWLKYFPPLAEADLRALGCKIDWRRSFITTDVNPYYDSFVRWQFNKLRALHKVKFGERHTIWSPKDGQPCMDHDRASGEGVGPQEYTGIKMEVLVDKVENPVIKELLNSPTIKGKKVYLVAATLRPETMYGQTNCFVGTNLEYGAWEINDNDVFICTERAAKNMAWQGYSKQKGVHVRLGTVKGADLIGTAVRAPLASYDFVYVLPLEHVLANKGTGVVTSVPSDSPDDYAMVVELNKKAQYYKIKPEWITSFKPIPIISTPNYGNMAAETAYQKFKISSPKDRASLDKAKEEVYKEGFYSGTMIIGDFKGKSVQDAKVLIRDLMVKKGEAIVYSEPEKDVISRSGDECVVNLCDQWYLDYGETEWRKQAVKVLEQMNTYHSETHNLFRITLDWLNQWACARSFGLGTKLPWDTQFVIESLSDSTIYMAYYTVAHLLQGGSLDGSKAGPLGIKASELTDEVWEYIFNDAAEFPKATAIAKEKLDKLKREFQYFYPLNLRVSGKDLIGNHLTFSIYNHACLFPETRQPKAFRANGHLLLNSEKMSKSTGNFLTLSQAIERYGADATRFALADAGDMLEDANFVEGTANNAILRLFTQKEWTEEIFGNLDKLRTGPADSFIDKVFLNDMNRLVSITEKNYENMLFREALKTGFYEFQDARDWYRETTLLTGEGMHKDLVLKFIEVQALLLAPFTPHFSEYIWRKLLKKPTSIMSAAYPTFDAPYDKAILSAQTYLRGVIHTIRAAEVNAAKRKGKKGKNDKENEEPSKDSKQCMKLFVADKFPEWQEKVIDVVKNSYNKETKTFSPDLMSSLKSSGLANKQSMPFVADLRKKVEQDGPAAFDRTLLFNEIEVLEKNRDFMCKSLGIQELNIVRTNSDTIEEDDKRKADSALPGAPTYKMYFI